MKLSFEPLSDSDFSHLLTWLQAPHVKKWWDPAFNYTLELVEKKYSTYVDGYKQVGDESNPIHAFIIHSDERPIGYIQYYNAYDFPSDGYQLNNLPRSLAAIDMFIGDENYLGKGVGQRVMELFLDNHVFTKFDYAFVDPDSSNVAAIKTYGKMRFKACDDQVDRSVRLMTKPKKIFDEIESLEKKLLASSIRKSVNMLDELLSDDFKEFGKTGLVYNKQDVLSKLSDEGVRDFNAKYFEVKLLENNVYLVTYTTMENGVNALRSSIWQSVDGRLQMVFHQGTEIRGI